MIMQIVNLTWFCRLREVETSVICHVQLSLIWLIGRNLANKFMLVQAHLDYNPRKSPYFEIHCFYCIQVLSPFSCSIMIRAMNVFVGTCVAYHRHRLLALSLVLWFWLCFPLMSSTVAMSLITVFCVARLSHLLSLFYCIYHLDVGGRWFSSECTWYSYSLTGMPVCS